MWPFLHINKHNIRTWTEVNEWKTLAEIKMMYNLRENTQRTFQVIALSTKTVMLSEILAIFIYDLYSANSWYSTQIWQCETISASISNHRKSATYLKSPLAVFPQQNLIKMNFADMRSFSAQLIMSLHTPDLNFKLEMVFVWATVLKQGCMC
jgi:hypothetical protein